MAACPRVVNITNSKKSELRKVCLLVVYMY